MVDKLPKETVSLDRWSSSDGGKAGVSHIQILCRLTQPVFHHQQSLVKLPLIVVTNRPLKQEWPVWMTWDMFILKKKKNRIPLVCFFYLEVDLDKSTILNASQSCCLHSAISVDSLQSERDTAGDLNSLENRRALSVFVSSFLWLTYAHMYRHTHT